MVSRLDRGNAVIAKARRAAPDDDVAMPKRKTPWPFRTPQPAEEEHCGKTERDRHDRRTEIALVAILMQRESRARIVAIDEARVGDEAFESCASRRLRRKLHERDGHRRPWTAAVGIACVVAVPAC